MSQPSFDEAVLLTRSGLFDLAWYERETAQSFADLSEAVAHYRATGAAMQLSPNPLFDPTVVRNPAGLTPLAAYLQRKRFRTASAHPGWDQEAYVSRHPKAADHPSGPLGHLYERLTPDTELHLRTLAGSTPTRWGDVSERWQDLAETWAFQRTLRLPAYVAALPEDHRLPEAPPVHPTPDSLVSIVIPTWNRSASLRKAIASVQAQMWPHWEALVVDDGSEDDTREVVEALAGADPRIRLVSRPHGGVCAARNAGLEAARGGLIAFLDSDNEWQPEYLDAMVRVMEAGRIDAAYGTLMVTTADGPRYRATKVTSAALMVANHVDLNVLVVRAGLMRRVGGFDVTLRRTVDYDLVIRLAQATELVHIPVVGVTYDNDKQAADRISVREPVAWSDHVQLSHRIDWAHEQAVERDPDLLSVVLPVSATPRIVLEQLQAVQEAFAGRRWEALVVDSTPSRRAVSLLAPVLVTDDRVHYERLPMRVSFGYAADVGFTRTRGGTVLFVESGVVATAEALERLAEFAAETAGAFIAQPVTVTEDDLVVTAGSVFPPGHPLPAAFLEGHGTREVDALGSEPLELQALDGGTFVARADDFAQARGLDVLLDNELELADLGLRLRSSAPGLRQVVLPSARVQAPTRTWDGDRSQASRTVFAQRHEATLDATPPEFWKRLGLMVPRWESVDGQPHAVREVPSATVRP